MQNVVNKLPFTHYTRTVEMLEVSESVVKSVTAEVLLAVSLPWGLLH